jgi:hypothetical protein
LCFGWTGKHLSLSIYRKTTKHQQLKVKQNKVRTEWRGKENGKNKGNEEKELKMWKLSSTEMML